MLYKCIIVVSILSGLFVIFIACIKKNTPVYRSAFRGSLVMERQLKNKVIVITGGAQGIGYAIADSFLQNGSKTIILLDINETVGAKAADTLNTKHGDDKAVFMKCDVTKDLEEVSSEILSMYEVDVLVNNAGILDETSARRTIEVNTIAVVEWGMKFWEYMRKDAGGRGGTILNVASIYGFLRDPWLMYYKTSKHGVIGFTKTLGHDYNYQKTGVRVVAICPGFTDTALTVGFKPLEFQKEDHIKFINNIKFQKVETVGEAAVDIFVVAESGSAWVSEEEEAIKPALIN